MDSATVALFLFGKAQQQHFAEPAGTMVAILNPTYLPSREGQGIALSVKEATQVLKLGVAAGFGFCRSKKKNGQPCTMPVNVKKCEHCEFHLATAMREMSKKRSNLNSSLTSSMPKMHDRLPKQLSSGSFHVRSQTLQPKLPSFLDEVEPGPEPIAIPGSKLVKSDAFAEMLGKRSRGASFVMKNVQKTTTFKKQSAPSTSRVTAAPSSKPSSATAPTKPTTPTTTAKGATTAGKPTPTTTPKGATTTASKPASTATAQKGTPTAALSTQPTAAATTAAAVGQKGTSTAKTQPQSASTAVPLTSTPPVNKAVPKRTSTEITPSASHGKTAARTPASPSDDVMSAQGTPLISEKKDKAEMGTYLMPGGEEGAKLRAELREKRRKREQSDKIRSVVVSLAQGKPLKRSFSDALDFGDDLDVDLDLFDDPLDGFAPAVAPKKAKPAPSSSASTTKPSSTPSSAARASSSTPSTSSRSAPTSTSTPTSAPTRASANAPSTSTPTPAPIRASTTAAPTPTPTSAPPRTSANAASTPTSAPPRSSVATAPPRVPSSSSSLSGVKPASVAGVFGAATPKTSPSPTASSTGKSFSPAVMEAVAKLRAAGRLNPPTQQPGVKAPDRSVVAERHLAMQDRARQISKGGSGVVRVGGIVKPVAPAAKPAISAARMAFGGGKPLSLDSREAQRVLKADSKYADSAEEAVDEALDKMMTVLEKKETLVKKMASVFEIQISGFACQKCDYIGEFKPGCANPPLSHVPQKVSTTKKFFECAHCKRPASAVGSMYPKHKCEKCGGDTYRKIGMMKEQMATNLRDQFQPTGTDSEFLERVSRI